MPITAHIAPIMPSRPCRLCFGLQNDSVFADFDADGDNQLFLRRISFDGYGCCHAPDDIGRMSADDSRTLLDFTAAHEEADPKIEAILQRHFRENAAYLWADALKKHRLI